MSMGYNIAVGTIKSTAMNYVRTNPLANARSYSADSSAADKKSNTGIFPFSV